MKRIFFCAVAVLMSIACSGPAPQQQAADPELQFDENGKFKIVQFTDTHLGYSRKDSFDESVRVIMSIVKEEKPDLVVFTGDIVTSAPMKDGIDNLLAPLDEMGVPTLYLLGNHDREDELPYWDIAKIVTSHSSVINTMYSGGLDDVAVRIKSADGSKVAAVIYGMDSNDYTVVPDHWDYGWVSHTQIDWYRNKSKEFTKANGNLPVPSYTYMHIPILEYTEADRDGHLTGNNFEGVFGPELNSGLLAAMEECADVHGIFVGHDHTNDFVSKLGAVAHVYGRCTGNGHPDRGGRVVELTEGDYGFRSWIREWDGDVVQDYTYEILKQRELLCRLRLWLIQDHMETRARMPVLYSKENFMCRKQVYGLFISWLMSTDLSQLMTSLSMILIGIEVLREYIWKKVTTI